MQVSVLGPTRVRADDGAPIEVGGARLRMLLARLALDANRPVSAESLVDGLWGEQPPADAANALQSLVSRLRRALGDSGRLTSAGGGYLLKVEEVDAQRFEDLAARGRAALAAGRHADASRILTEALALWRGEALSDVLEAPFAQAPAARLGDLCAAAMEDRFEAELELGRHAEVLADLDAAGARHPLRERLAGLRMRALYAAGRQSDALALYERTRATLAEELGIDPSAELRETHLAVLRGELARPRHVKDHLPVALTSFVGRQQEMDQLAEALRSARLVTLTGPGGAGKTRLATETAARHSAYEGWRVWFVPLASVRDAGDIIGAVLAVLDTRLLNTKAAVPGVEPIDRVAELVGGGETLLVLDNCEHLVAAAAELAHDLLTRLPGLRILATSREPLAITGELLCPLGPLATPEAVRLFVERAAAVRPGFVLDKSTVDPVQEICRRLDGMPLALELAAARLRSMTAAQIERRLDDRFRLLTNGSRVALPRQRTLRAVVEWSWDLLEKPERVLARRLSSFPGGATVVAMEDICADDLLPAEDVLYVLGSLVEKSIVDAVEGDEPRYRMLETLRAYGEERLDEAGERELVTDRFARYYLRIAEENEPRLRGPGQLEAIRALEAEQDNMLTAIHRAMRADEAEVSYRFVTALAWYWVIRGFHEQPSELLSELLRFEGRIPADVFAGVRVLHAMLSAAPMRGPMPDLDEMVEECHRAGTWQRFPEIAFAVPMLCFLAGKLDLAERELRFALRIDDPWARACSLWVKAFLLDNIGDLDGGERARDEALARYREVGDRWGIAMTLAMRANTHSLRGRHEEAIRGYEQGLAMARELWSTDDIIQQTGHLANERLRSGDPAGAWRDIEEALAVAEDSNRPDHKAFASFTLFEIARQTGDLGRAREALEWLIEVAPQLPFPMNMADEWVGLLRTSLAVDEGDPAAARETLPPVLHHAVHRRDLPDVASAAQVAARLLAAEGNAAGSARMLGLCTSIRGTFDHGSPELARLVEKLVDELGRDVYESAYIEAAALPQNEALDALLAAFPQT